MVDWSVTYPVGPSQGLQRHQRVDNLLENWAAPLSSTCTAWMLAQGVLKPSATWPWTWTVQANTNRFLLSSARQWVIHQLFYIGRNELCQLSSSSRSPTFTRCKDKTDVVCPCRHSCLLSLLWSIIHRIFNLSNLQLLDSLSHILCLHEAVPHQNPVKYELLLVSHPALRKYSGFKEM